MRYFVTGTWRLLPFASTTSLAPAAVVKCSVCWNQPGAWAVSFVPTSNGPKLLALVSRSSTCSSLAVHTTTPGKPWLWLTYLWMRWKISLYRPGGTSATIVEPSLNIAAGLSNLEVALGSTLILPSSMFSVSESIMRSQYEVRPSNNRAPIMLKSTAVGGSILPSGDGHQPLVTWSRNSNLKGTSPICSTSNEPLGLISLDSHLGWPVASLPVTVHTRRMRSSTGASPPPSALYMRVVAPCLAIQSASWPISNVLPWPNMPYQSSEVRLIIGLPSGSLGIS